MHNGEPEKYYGPDIVVIREAQLNAMQALVRTCIDTGVEEGLGRRALNFGSGPPNASNPLPPEEAVGLRPSPWLEYGAGVAPS